MEGKSDQDSLASIVAELCWQGSGLSWACCSLVLAEADHLEKLWQPILQVPEASEHASSFG